MTGNGKVMGRATIRDEAPNSQIGPSCHRVLRALLKSVDFIQHKIASLVENCHHSIAHSSGLGIFKHGVMIGYVPDKPILTSLVKFVSLC